MLNANLPRCLCKKLLLDCLDTGSLLFKSVKTHSSFSVVEVFRHHRTGFELLGATSHPSPCLLCRLRFLHHLYHVFLYFVNLSSINPTSIKLNLIYIIPISVKLDSVFYNVDRLGNSIREISPYQVSLSLSPSIKFIFYFSIYNYYMHSRFFGSLYCARQEGLTCGSSNPSILFARHFPQTSRAALTLCTHFFHLSSMWFRAYFHITHGFQVACVFFRV